MQNPLAKPSNINFSVNFVRAVAILMVVFVHASSFPYNIPGEINSFVIFNWFTSDVYGAVGYLGVPLFVMLSGTLLLDPAKADEPIGEFYKKRFNRIGVPLIFWSIVFFVWNYSIHNQPLTLFNIEQGILTGTYPILWFLYLLVGLYLATPILRVLVKHLDHQKFTLLIVLWFIGTVAVPFIHTFTGFNYNPLMFVFTDWVGYYLLGVFLVNAKPRRSTLYLMLFLGLLTAIVGDWYITAAYGAGKTGYFHGYLSFNMILASVALFAFLVSIPKTHIEKGNNAALRLMHWIGKNTLPFYLLHIIVLEVLQIGLLGFRYPYTGIVLIDAIGLFLSAFTLSAAIIYVVKKVPFACKLIG